MPVVVVHKYVFLPLDGDHSRPGSASSDTASSTGRKTPMRKISHEEINPRHLPLKPMVSTDDFGSPSFYTPEAHSPSLTRRSVLRMPDLARPTTRRISHYHTPHMKPNATDDADGNNVIDERDMIMELVRDIAMDLDVTSVSHRILQVGSCFVKQVAIT